jgi:hypothetical protein
MMAKRFQALNVDHQAFVAAQNVFFVATGAPDGHVNLFSKGCDSLRVSGADRIGQFKNLHPERDPPCSRAENNGGDGIYSYWHAKNCAMIDGLPTGLSPT